MKRKLTLSALFLATPFFLSGCFTDYPQFQTIDQSELCIASTDKQAMECPEGKLFMARLTQANRDLRAFNTLNTAALYCDTNHPIFENDAGIICVMTHERIDMLTGGDSTAQGMEPDQNPSGDAAQDTSQEGQSTE
ncbi:hypothetical protein OM427_29815 [Halomonas sp. 18H]|nr:hypothetical protein [Halomonas sp. 18H]MCW4153706.1 hypothetical protein [Halomonas sp. 18H]